MYAISVFTAYSLHAWLATSIEGLYEEGFIRYWDDVLLALKAFISSEGGSINNDGTFNFPNSFSEAEKNWAYFVRDYERSDIESNLLNSSVKFGQNQWIDRDYFVNQYLTPLMSLMKSILPMASDDVAVWTQEQHNQWIST